jgi:hypothetical protein
MLILNWNVEDEFEGLIAKVHLLHSLDATCRYMHCIFAYVKRKAFVIRIDMQGCVAKYLQGIHMYTMLQNTHACTYN